MEESDYEGSACKMRYFFKDPTYEMLPLEETNVVPLITKLRPGCRFMLAHPYPCLVDPTRTINMVRRFKIFSRDEIEMYHYSFVRRDLRKKLLNVSNRGNYEDIDDFLGALETWDPSEGILHPHPYFRQHFKEIKIVPNYFEIPHFSITSTASTTSSSRKKQG